MLSLLICVETPFANCGAMDEGRRRQISSVLCNVLSGRGMTSHRLPTWVQFILKTGYNTKSKLITNISVSSEFYRRKRRESHTEFADMTWRKGRTHRKRKLSTNIMLVYILNLCDGRNR